MITCIIATVLMAVLFTVLIVLDINNAWSTFLPAELTGGNESLDFMAGFRTGFCISIVGVMIIKAAVFAKALRSGKKLKELYIKETDERTVLIGQKTSAASFSITTLSLAVAAVVSSFFSITVLYTLICAIFFICLVQVGFHFYYSRKY